MALKGNTSDVHFDYDGSLASARQLWSLAQDARSVDSGRHSAGTDGLANFRGSYADQFISRLSDEDASGSRIAYGLQADANACAVLWKKAMDEQNRRSYARHVEKLKSDRSGWEKTVDFFNGYDAPAAPDGVRTPVPPSFAPTATPVKYPS